MVVLRVTFTQISRAEKPHLPHLGVVLTSAKQQIELWLNIAVKTVPNYGCQEKN